MKEIQAGGPVSKVSGEGGESAEAPQPAKATFAKAADQKVSLSCLHYFRPPSQAAYSLTHVWVNCMLPDAAHGLGQLLTCTGSSCHLSTWDGRLAELCESRAECCDDAGKGCGSALSSWGQEVAEYDGAFLCQAAGLVGVLHQHAAPASLHPRSCSGERSMACHAGHNHQQQCIQLAFSGAEAGPDRILSVRKVVQGLRPCQDI